MIIPRLYNAETTDFSDNGIGVLADAIECKVTQGYGSSLLEMKYPLDGRLFSELRCFRIIYAQPEPDAKPQPYSIYKMRKISDGVASVSARHICYNLDGVVIVPFGQMMLNDLLSKIDSYVVTGKSVGMTEPEQNRHKFNFNFEIDSGGFKFFSIKKPTDLWSMIGKEEGSILEKFKKEVEFDDYTVRFVTRRGKDNGASIKYGVNLLSVEQEEIFSKCYSGIVGYYIAPDGECIYEIVYGAGKHPLPRFLPVDFTGTVASQSDLLESAKAYVEEHKIGLPQVNLTVQMATLRASKGTENIEQIESVSMGDTVYVYFPALDISSSARVSKTVYDCLRGHYDSLEIGGEKKNAADIIENNQRLIGRLMR